ncbi:hypothetical protein [Novosphingobium rosa]|uniref:hypothetical protein n=1 Tax=Novosphingobium rosa TaxID=76978 RepID=UPI0012EE58B4|nr:hypothetical protein [Novosphingobium rosa]
MEGELVLNALVKRVASIRLDGTPLRRPNNTMSCMAHLPIAMEPIATKALAEPV